MTVSYVRALDLGVVMLRRAHSLSWLLLLVTAACSGTDERAPVARSSGLGTSVVADITPCSEGEVQDCSIFIKERAGVVTCAPGIQICESGRFSECELEGSGSSAGAAGAPFDD
jgi:hypothetical protein